MQNKKWTILFVCNEHSFVYMPFQFRYFYERNSPSEFEILIVSNWNNDALKALVADYNDKYGNCRIVDFIVADNIEITEDNKFKHEEVDQHGESLNFGIQNVNTPYVIVQDPDFFWLKRNIFALFKKYLDQGYEFIGAPYPRKVGVGAPDFPALYATVTRTALLKSVDLRGTYNDKNLRKELENRFPEPEWTFSGDVGFQVREKYSDRRFLSFSQEQDIGIIRSFGSYSLAIPYRYCINKEEIGEHLFGGCRNVENSLFNTMLSPLQKADLNDFWIVQRERYSRYLLSFSEEKTVVMPQKIWTVVFVNYKTSYYLKWQIKCLFDFNNPKEFDLIIVDNSNPSEVKHLEQLCKPYKKFQNIKIIPYNPIDKSASGQHGEALTLALQYANSKYFLANDPDFFWTKQGHLKWLEKLLNAGKIAIGSPYECNVGNGAASFPCAWGAAYRTDEIKYLDFSAISDREKFMESFKKYPGKSYSFDVGWKIRVAISNIFDPVTGLLLKRKDYIAFDFKRSLDIQNYFGKHSYELCTSSCFYKGELVAQHLFRGSFTSAPDGNKDLNLDLSNEIIKIRENIAKYFYTIYSGKAYNIQNQTYFKLYFFFPLLSFEFFYNIYTIYLLGIRFRIKKKIKEKNKKMIWKTKLIGVLVIYNREIFKIVKERHIKIYILNKRVI